MPMVQCQLPMVQGTRVSLPASLAACLPACHPPIVCRPKQAAPACCGCCGGCWKPCPGLLLPACTANSSSASWHVAAAVLCCACCALGCGGTCQPAIFSTAQVEIATCSSALWCSTRCCKLPHSAVLPLAWTACLPPPQLPALPPLPLASVPGLGASFGAASAAAGAQLRASVRVWGGGEPGEWLAAGCCTWVLPGLLFAAAGLHVDDLNAWQKVQAMRA